ncbi:MAG: uracil-DNA glycosylase [Chloroflexi bacterium]|nr:uracil-DNA glycosylase [Chloroflexota bacterium]
MSEFDELVQQVNACTKCGLSKGRTKAVPGDGSRTAQIMFIGEGPGYYEDQRGLPFVGPAGQLLNELLASIGLKRSDVYITNMVKCRPPNNRDPLPGEIQACGPYLDGQLELIAPKVVVTLGRYSFGKFFPGESISKARGKPRKWRNMVIYPMYHPAAALHNPKLKGDLESDFKKLPALIESVGQQQPQEQQAAVAPSRQLNLFE